MSERVELTLGHSPDADDAFMWWPLTGKLDPASGQGSPRAVSPPLLDAGRLSFRAVAADIEQLNRRAIEQADLDITAMSFHAYGAASGRYELTSCGASMGDGYGPKLVCRREERAADLMQRLLGGDAGVAVPGKHTTAYLTLCLLLGGEPQCCEEMRFDRVLGAVASGEADAGLVIHEGQLTFADAGLTEVADLGAWWKERTGLPLPLGANAVRRDLDERFGAGTAAEVVTLLSASIAEAMERMEESISYAAGFAPATPLAHVRRFVEMYVNRWTIDAGEEGRMAVEALLREAAERRLCPPVGTITMRRPT
jgi:1,4-dihydroxy-6-naphthoate synthase